jgi:tetratricopeptide (TPR) repeat protein
MVHKAYDSDPVPFSFTKEQYRQGTREAVLYSNYKGKKLEGYYDVKELIEFVKNEDLDHKVQVSKETWYNYFPTKNMRVTVDSATVVNNGTVPKELAGRIVKNIDWSPGGSYIQKNDLMVIDLLAHNNWKRPIYFAATAPPETYLNLAPYLQLEGLAYRLVPIKQNEKEGQGGDTRVATDIMYDNFMNKFRFGNMEKPGIYLDDVFLRSCALNIRQRAGQLGSALAEEGKKDKAIKVLDKAMAMTPFENAPIDATLYSIVLAYYQAGAKDKADALAKKLFDNYEGNLNYYYSLDRSDLASYGPEIKQAQGIMEQLISFANYFKETALSKQFEDRYMLLLNKYHLKPRRGGEE